VTASAGIRISEACWPQDRETVESLFREYVASLTADIGFQDVEAEIATLPGKYARPTGVVLIARSEDRDTDDAGLIAYRMLEPAVCEMKRLYVRPAFRGRHVGWELAEELIFDARQCGYRTMVLDTLSSMQPAVELYRRLGFKPVPAYYDNPLPGATYMALDLE
jgi:putative acetyltransferase